MSGPLRRKCYRLQVASCGLTWNLQPVTRNLQPSTHTNYQFSGEEQGCGDCNDFITECLNPGVVG